MTIQYYSRRLITGTSGDTKPSTNTLPDTVYLETDTFKQFGWNGSTWIQYETLAQTNTNKTLSTESNTISNLLLTSVFAQNSKRTGAIITACTAADSLTGHLRGMTVNGDGTPTWAMDATEGPVLSFSRGSSGIMGYTSTGTSDRMVTRRALNPYFKLRYKFNNITTTRLYIGFTSAASLPNTDTPLATGDSGVIFGHRTTDSNYSVINNDGGGTAIVNDMGTVKEIANYHTVSFNFGASNVIVILDDGAGNKTQTISSRIPATSTDIYLSVIAAY